MFNSKKYTTMKTKIFNVMILDKSGSMNSIARQAVTGVNETLASIRSQQLKNPEQDNYVTLVAFCGCELKTIYDQVPIAETKDLTDSDYRPCCMTPLYDAVGTTITRIHQLVSAEDTAVAVTIITDGYENASREFSHKAIQSLISTYKEEGWLFAYIGADHDVEAVAYSLHIDNAMQFEKTEEGTKEMFKRNRVARMGWSKRVLACMAEPCGSIAEKRSRLKSASADFFSIDDENDA